MWREEKFEWSFMWHRGSGQQVKGQCCGKSLSLSLFLSLSLTLSLTREVIEWIGQVSAGREELKLKVNCYLGSKS